jgi:hypothetical protein
MPKLVLRVSTDCDDKALLREVAEELSVGLSRLIERPLPLVGVDLQVGQILAFAGDAKRPAAFAEVRGASNVDLSHNTQISDFLAELLQRRFGVPSDRYYVHFQKAAREDIGTRGRTLANLAASKL